MVFALLVGSATHSAAPPPRRSNADIILAASPEAATSSRVDWDAELDREAWIGPATQKLLDASYFEVRNAGEKGMGLFATCDIEKGTYLLDYAGRILTLEEYEGGSDYAVCVRNAAGAQCGRSFGYTTLN